MGTWGPHSLDNDVARDWLGVYRVKGLPAARKAMRAVLDADDVIDADTGARGLAACEVVTAALERGAAAIDDLPEVDADKAQRLADDLGDFVIMRMTGEASELATLWKDAGPDEFDAWIASLTSLRARLSGAEEAPDAGPLAAGADGGVLTLEVIERRIAALDADLQVFRQEMADGIRQIRRDIKGLTA